MVVVTDPQPYPVLRILEARELDTGEVFLKDGFPEPFDLTQGLGVVRRRFDMGDAVLFELTFEAASAVPVGVLAAIVGKHLLGWIVFPFSPPVDLNEVVRRLAAEEVHASDVAGEVVDEADEVSVIAAQAEGEDVRLPELVGRAALEEAGSAWVVGPCPPERCVQVLRDQRPADSLRAAGKKE